MSSAQSGAGFDHLAYYVRQGRFTDPEEYAQLFDGLPAEIPALCRVVQGLVIHWPSSSPSRRRKP